MQKKAIASVFHQIKNLLKAGIPTVIRVRYYSTIQLLTKLGEPPDFAVVLRWASILNQFHILPIHGENQIELLKIRVTNLAGA